MAAPLYIVAYYGPLWWYYLPVSGLHDPRLLVVSVAGIVCCGHCLLRALSVAGIVCCGFISVADVVHREWDSLPDRSMVTIISSLNGFVKMDG